MDNTNKGARLLIMMASIIVVIGGLKIAAPLIVPFLGSFFLALITLPLLNWLRSVKIPTSIAVLISLVAALSVLALVVFIIGGSVKSFNAEVPKYKTRLDILWGGILQWFETQGFDIPDEVSLDLFKPAALMDVAAGTLKGIANVMSNVFLVLLAITFILFEAAGFPRKLQMAFGDEGSSERYETIRSDVQKYLGIKTLTSLATGCFIWIILAIIGIDFPILWGLLAFLLNYIPNLGSIIAAVPPVLLAIIQFGLGHALGVALVFGAVNITLGGFVEPYFMGRRLGLSTLVVFLSLVFWGWVWGPVGMLLSVPLTMIIKILLENIPDLRWLSILLGPSPGERDMDVAPDDGGPAKVSPHEEKEDSEAGETA